MEEGEAVTVEIGVGAFTVTVALPVRSPALEVQFASDNVAIVYVVFATGVTITVIVGAVPLKAVPLDKVPLIVPEPVTVRVRVALPPAHIARCATYNPCRTRVYCNAYTPRHIIGAGCRGIGCYNSISSCSRLIAKAYEPPVPGIGDPTALAPIYN